MQVRAEVYSAVLEQSFRLKDEGCLIYSGPVVPKSQSPVLAMPGGWVVNVKRFTIPHERRDGLRPVFGTTCGNSRCIEREHAVVLRYKPNHEEALTYPFPWDIGTKPPKTLVTAISRQLYETAGGHLLWLGDMGGGKWPNVGRPNHERSRVSVRDALEEHPHRLGRWKSLCSELRCVRASHNEYVGLRPAERAVAA